MGRQTPRSVGALIEHLTSTQQTFSLRPPASPTQSYDKVTNNVKEMAKSLVVNPQLVNNRISVLREPFTAVEVAVKQEQGEQKKKTAAGWKGDILHTRLPALGTKSGYVAQTIDELVREGIATQNDTLKNCVSSQLVSNRTSVLKGPCTAVEVAVKLERGEQEKKMTAGQKGDTLYNRLSALGTKRGSLAQTTDELAREGLVPQNDTLKNCINLQLVSNRTSVRRGPCTAVEVAMMLEQGEQKKIPTAAQKADTLYTRLSELDTKKGYVAQVIDQYVRECRVPQSGTLRKCVKKLCESRKHHLALEIFEWMEKKNFALNHALRLDIISKVHGITAAENYLNGLSPSGKNLFTYEALLNSYCQENMIDKALNLFEKMDQEGGNKLPAFNNLMSLHMKLCQPEKVPPLVLQMKERKIQLDTFTYNIWMNSFSSLNDIAGVERVFDEIKKDCEEKCDWTTYQNLALAYVKAGLIEKAELALKKCEQHIRPHNPKAFSWLISLYAEMSNLAEVHRVWKSRKSYLNVVYNTNYCSMLHALSKLNDIEGMRKCFEEWEFEHSFYDIRLAKIVMGGYLKHDMVEEAEKILYRAIVISNGPVLKAWELLIHYYLKSGQMKLAWECLKATIPGIDKSYWLLRPENERMFLSYFEEENGIDGFKKIYKYLRKAKTS